MADIVKGRKQPRTAIFEKFLKSRNDLHIGSITAFSTTIARKGDPLRQRAYSCEPAMTDRFNPSDAQNYFTAKFWKDHVFVGAEHQKKKAETVFQRRDVRVSSVICLTRAELAKLAGEIHQRQAEFARGGSHSKYTTVLAYDIWTRGGSRPKDRQSASHHKSTFRYAVQRQADGHYTLHHFDG